MKLYVWRGERTNFGDELNTWLMPRVFPGFFDDDDAQLFLGIGSTLFDIFPKASTKIVLGAGFAGYTALPRFDNSWRFYGVRGPRTAKLCGLGPEMAVGDAAILMARYLTPVNAPGAERGQGFAFMPHYHSLDRGNWPAACALAGVRFIDPCAPVEEVLQAIRTSGVVIAEAMHGAILADVMRVPWIAALPVHRSHRMKWRDWAEGLDIDLTPHAMWPSSSAEVWVNLRAGGGNGAGFRNLGGVAGAVVGALDQGLVRLAAAWLTRMTKQAPMLSADAALARAVERLEAGAKRIRQDYPR
jgi:succinoglycan biosynthesis protein ExoV